MHNKLVCNYASLLSDFDLLADIYLKGKVITAATKFKYDQNDFLNMFGSFI